MKKTLFERTEAVGHSQVHAILPSLRKDPSSDMRWSTQTSVMRIQD